MELEEGGGLLECGEKELADCDGAAVGGWIVSEDGVPGGGMEKPEHAPADLVGEGGVVPRAGRNRIVFADSAGAEILVHATEELLPQFRYELFVHIGKKTQFGMKEMRTDEIESVPVNKSADIFEGAEHAETVSTRMRGRLPDAILAIEIENRVGDDDPLRRQERFKEKRQIGCHFQFRIEGNVIPFHHGVKKELVAVRVVQKEELRTLFQRNPVSGPSACPTGLPQNLPVRIHAGVAALDQIGSGLFRCGKEVFQKIRSDPVVGIDKGQIASGRILQAGVQRGRIAALFLGENAHLRKTGGIVAQEFAGAVGGAVVDGDQFEILHGLRHQRIQGAGQVRSGIVDRKEN